MAFAVGLVGQAFSFDGINDYVKVPKSASLDAPNHLTIDFWVKVDPSQPIGSRVVGLVTSDFYGLEIGTAASKLGVQFFISTDNGGHYVSTSDLNGSGAVFPAGDWHHIAGVYDGAKVQLYLDGQALGNPAPVTGQVSPMLASSFVAFGSSDGRTVCSSQCIGTRYFKGQIDEVDFFNRALSASEIAAIYNAGSAGKCPVGTAPSITAQPASQTGTGRCHRVLHCYGHGRPAVELPMGFQRNQHCRGDRHFAHAEQRTAGPGGHLRGAGIQRLWFDQQRQRDPHSQSPTLRTSTFGAGQLVAWGRELSGRGRDE